MTPAAGEARARSFRVWAPRAERGVELEIGGRRRPMEREGAGWWRREEASVAPGELYRFALDGGDALPDPRTRFQPQGVHGPSAVVDLSGFGWTDGSWRGVELEDLTVYELHIGTFTPEGTLDAAAGRLQHLVDLGVTAVELLPVNDFPGSRGWGYDGAHWWAVHRAYGGPEALCRFVDMAHARGLAVLLDVVYNHLGPDGAVLDRFGPYTTDRYSTPWGGALNLDDDGSDEVRAFIVDNAVMWLEDYHIDGLRLDAVHAFLDRSAVHLLEELGSRVRALSASAGRPLLVIAESDLNDPRLVREGSAGGFALDAQWSDDFHHALWAALTGERGGYYADFRGLEDVRHSLHRGVIYEGAHSEHRGRRHGRPFEGVPPQRLLGYLQNHDQVGNRAGGERSAALLDSPALMAAAATVLLAPFTPMLFMGEEWGASTPWQYFTDHQDPELGRAVSEGRRREFRSFGWRDEDVPDPQDPATFERSRLRWEELGEPAHARLLAWHRDLLALRREHRLGHAGGWNGSAGFEGVSVEVDPEARVLVVRNRDLLLAWNLGEGAAVVTLRERDAARLLLASGDVAAPAGGRLELAPGVTAVLQTAP